MTPGYLEFDNPGYKELEMHSKSVVSCILTSLTITLTLLDDTLFLLALDKRLVLGRLIVPVVEKLFLFELRYLSYNGGRLYLT